MISTLFLKICYIVFWVATGFIRQPYARQQKQNLITNNQKTPLEKLLLVGVIIGMMVLPLLYVFTPLLDFSNYHLPAWASIIGLALMPFTLWLFYRSHKDLGKNWSPSLEVRANHTLVTEGVYKKVRHPMYSAIWLWSIMQALVLHNYIAGLGALLTFGLLYFLRVGREESMMIAEFGPIYEAYIMKTGRVFPKF